MYSLEDKIVKLRKEGKTYNDIMEILNCGKSIISYHSRRNGLGVGIKKNGFDEILTDAERKKRNVSRVKTYRQILKEKAVNYKGGCCERCGYDKCKSALEFHHLDPNEKDFGISSYTVLSWEKIRQELDKCIMVCANCHREIHEEMIK